MTESIPVPSVVIIMREPHTEDQWHALFQTPNALYDEALHRTTGTREEMIAWAWQRCDYVMIWSDELQDVMKLESEGS